MPRKKIEEQFAASVTRLQDIITRRGWVVQPVVETDDPPGAFAYTIGLQKTFGHPELALFGFEPSYMQEILNTLAQRVKKGETLPVNLPYGEVFGSVPVVLIPVQQRQAEFFRAFNTFYPPGEMPPVLQVIIPDNTGRFPWQDGCNAKCKELQILLGDPPALH